MFKSKILTLIAVVSIVITCALPAFVKFVIWPAYDQFVLGKTEKALQFLAEKMVKNQELRTPFNKATPVSPILIDEVERVRATVGLLKVKIFTPEALIVYSSDPRDVGNCSRQTFFAQMLLDGRPRSELVRKLMPGADGAQTPRDIIETYVPIITEGVVIGAFEIYYDVTEINASLRALMETQWRILVPVALFLLICALVSTYFASRSMQALAEAKERFKEQSITDPLTGVLNHRGFTQSVMKHLKVVDRGDRYAFLMFIDLNDFKQINDRLGHEVGESGLSRGSRNFAEDFP